MQAVVRYRCAMQRMIVSRHASAKAAERALLAGAGPIEVGKLQGKELFLPGTLISLLATICMAVDPVPMTPRRAPSRGTSWSQRALWKTAPAKVSRLAIAAARLERKTSPAGRR